jgi:hypothetical protein
VSKGQPWWGTDARWHRRSGIGDPRSVRFSHFKLANSKIPIGTKDRGPVDLQVTYEGVSQRSERCGRCHRGLRFGEL